MNGIRRALGWALIVGSCLGFWALSILALVITR